MKELPSCVYLHGLKLKEHQHPNITGGINTAIAFSQKQYQEEKLREAGRKGDYKPPQGQVTVSQHFPSTSVQEEDILERKCHYY